VNRFFQLRGITPTVEFTNENGHFQCRMKAQGILFAAKGAATSKKAAKEAALHSFYNFLAKTGRFNEGAVDGNPVKKRKVEDPAEASASSPAPAKWVAAKQEMTAAPKKAVPTMAAAAVRGVAAPTSAPTMANLAMRAPGLLPAPRQPGLQAAVGEKRSWISTVAGRVTSLSASASSAAKAVTQPAVATPQLPAESPKEEETGEFTLMNARGRLNHVLQLWRQKTDMPMSCEGPPHMPRFTASISFKVPKTGRFIKEKFTASSKKDAQNSLALKLCKQLSRMGLMPKNFKSKKAQTLQESLQDSKYMKQGQLGFKLDTTMESRVRRFLRERGYDIPSGPFRTPVSWMAMMAGRKWLAAGSWGGMFQQQQQAGVLSWASPVFASRRPWLEAPPEHRKADFQQEWFMKQVGKPKLPVDDSREVIAEAIANHKVVIIRGATGSGKTTQVPQYILDHGDGEEKCIVVLQPRRISAISVAQRVAAERGEGLGESVGYAVRFEQRWPRTSGSICYMTTGFFLKRLHSRGLQGISHVVVDEIHQRHVDNDLMLTLLRDAVAVHDGLKVVLMSATIDADKFQGYMCAANIGTVPIINVEGRMFDVQVFYMEDIQELLPASAPLCRSVSSSSAASGGSGEETIPLDLIVNLLKFVTTQMKATDRHGSVLIFLPTWATMSDLLKKLREDPALSSKSTFVLLHSQIPKEDQMAAFRPAPAGKTKVIISTDIAESSITISDVSVVIDSGRVKLTAHAGATGLSVHQVTWAGRVNFEQRKGRAGRTKDGMCFRLCTQAFYESELQDEVPPELVRTPLTEACLLIKSLAFGEPADVLGSCLDPPREEAVARAMDELRLVRAVDANDGLTHLGRALARLPLSPRMGVALLMGHWLFDLGPAMSLLCASMSFDEPYFLDHSGGYVSWSLINRFSGTRKHSDHFLLAMLHQEYQRVHRTKGEDAARQFCTKENLHPAIMRQVREATLQLRGLVEHKDMQSLLMEEQEDLDADWPQLSLRSSASTLIKDWGQHEWQWGAIRLLLAIAMPNLGVHEDKRKIWTGEDTLGVMHRASVNCSTTADIEFSSPIFTFLELVRDEGAEWKQGRCRQLTMIPPVLAVLRPFAAGEVAAVSANTLVAADWVPITPASSSSAHLMLLLRMYIEDMVADVAGQANPKASSDDGLRQLLKELVVQVS